MAHKIDHLSGFATVWGGYYRISPDWLETYTEIAIELGYQVARNNQFVMDVIGHEGQLGLRNLVMRLTQEFEELHKGRQWDGEWFDEIDSFLNAKLK